MRVIYVHTPEITVYGKDEADDLTKDEVRQLCELAKTLRALAAARAAKGKRP